MTNCLISYSFVLKRKEIIISKIEVKFNVNNIVFAAPVTAKCLMFWPPAASPD